MLSRHIIQILQDDKQGRPEPLASGLLVSTAKGEYLVSAAHVFDEAQSGARLYFWAGNRQNRNLVEATLVTPKGKSRRDDKIDIGVMRFGPLGRPPYPAADKIALPASALRRDCVPRGGRHYFALGFPASKTETHRGRKEVLAVLHGVRGRSIDEEDYAAAGLHPATHIAMEFNRSDQYTLDGHRQTAPHPRGMSGCPIWMVHDRDEPNDDKHTPVIAICIEYDRMRQLLVGTDIGVALDIIAVFEGDTPAPQLRS